MPAPSERDSNSEPAPGIEPGWLRNSFWQVPKLKISKVRSWPSITAMSFHRDGGETIWRGDRHRLVLTLEEVPPPLLQVEHGLAWQSPPNAPDALGFYPAGVTVRVVHGAARHVQVLWDADFHSTMLPELGAAAPQWESLYPLHDPLLSQIVKTLAQETEGGFADRILVDSLGTALCIRVARHFVGHLPLPTRGGLSAKRLERVRDYVEAHLGNDLSLTVLADVACLSPYHFSRSFKQATGVGPQRYVIQRRLEPLAWIAREAGFADQSHLTQVFRRAIGVTPGHYRSTMA